MSILALFSPELESLAGSRAMDITLDGEDPVLPRVAKMTLIIPRGGLEGVSLPGPNQFAPFNRWNGARAPLTFLLGPATLNDPTNSYILP